MMLAGMSGHIADDSTALGKVTQDQWKRSVRGTLPGYQTTDTTDFKYLRMAAYLGQQPKFCNVPHSDDGTDGEKAISAAKKRWCTTSH